MEFRGRWGIETVRIQPDEAEPLCAVLLARIEIAAMREPKLHRDFGEALSKRLEEHCG